jgi:hypothetical protein
MSDLFLALIHHPVLDRNGRIVTSAITSLDLHDIARSAHTYDVKRAYIVHPIPEQREFAATVIDYWRFDFGRIFDGLRREALETIKIVDTLDDALADATAVAQARPLIVHTSARTSGGMATAELRARMEAAGAPPMLVLFGTGFGLAPSVRERADIVINAILGPGAYNHLSVRAAVSIMLDRLRGR